MSDPHLPTPNPVSQNNRDNAYYGLLARILENLASISGKLDEERRKLQKLRKRLQTSLQQLDALSGGTSTSLFSKITIPAAGPIWRPGKI